ncbi:S-adenosyl-L-methionine-dependent methyltransferase [Xylariaceae sp. FL1651]|nr:S-adenosyl-L-methionine-dependent methyltransferase [Xylariaceae sp. FL1651]
MSGQSSASGAPQTTPATAPEVTTATTSDSRQDGGSGSAESTTAKPTLTPAPVPPEAATAVSPVAESTAAVPTTVEPTTAGPSTAEPTTAGPTTAGPSTAEAATAPTPSALPQNILPASHWAQAPPVDNDDVDSAYGDDNASSTASLSASILEYRTVHGRTFHSERGNAQSWNPNDAQHEETMDILHHVSTLLQDGKLTLARIDDNVQKVLDVGCGTGIWPIDFADQYPNAEVIGVDISPQQPQWIPPNLKFEIDDVTQPWTYEPDSFDYIHMRWLVGAIPDWYALFREVFRALKPGGTFESKESSCMIQADDGTCPQGCALDQWGRVFWEAGKRFGRTFRVVEDDVQKKAMEAAGFVDIQVVNLKTPLGPWPADPKQKEIGQYNRLALEQDIEGFIVYMWTTIMGWSIEEVSVYAAHLRRELRSPNFHAYYPQRVVIGRKP